MSSEKKYKYLHIHGPISVLPVRQLPPHRRSSPASQDGPTTMGNSRTDVDVVLLMGLTGVGKSTFIERFCDPGKDLAISKNQLEGFTKDIMAYRLVNINNGVPCYLLDTPGLADNRISEMSIILQIQEWMKANAVYSLNAILYFDRITDIRMPSSKRRTIQLFKTLMGEDAARSVTIATTMWDQLWNEKQEGAAESRFEELKEHWKGFIAVDSAILRFMNTRESAMEILDCCLKREGYWAFEYLAPTAAQGRPSDYNHNRDKPFGLALYQNLCNRIEELERQRLAVEFDLNQGDTEANAELAEILVQKRTEITMDLQRFEQELRDFLDTLPPVTKYPRIKGRWHRRYDSVMKPTKRAIRALPMYLQPSCRLFDLNPDTLS